MSYPKDVRTEWIPRDGEGRIKVDLSGTAEPDLDVTSDFQAGQGIMRGQDGSILATATAFPDWLATTEDLDTKLDRDTDVAAVGRGAGLFVDDPAPWYTEDGGRSFSFGNRKNSIGFAGTPASAPTTTIGAGGVTLPLAGGVVPVAECSALDPRGGSFTLGGQIVVYTGRSTSSGPGSATGCFTRPAATGTFPDGTALSYTQIGWGPFRHYQVFGSDGIPLPGSVQGVFGITRFEAPTTDDSAEGWSHAVVATGSYTQRRPVTGGEFIAQIAGTVSLPEGYTGALIGGGVRTNTPEASRAAQVIGWKLGHNTDGGGGGWSDRYDGIYQSTSALETFGVVSGAVSAGSGKTIAFTGAAKRPPTPTPDFPGRVLCGANAHGMGGQQTITYTGITGSGSTGTLTGCTVSTPIADGARLTNDVRSLHVKDCVGMRAGWAVGDTGFSGSAQMALRGGTDAVQSMLALTGPTDAEVPGGLTLLRLNAGAGQTRDAVKIYDQSGVNRASINPAGTFISHGQSFVAQTSGTNTAIVGHEGYVQPGKTAARGGVNALGAKINSGTGAPDYSAAIGDVYIRTDTPTVANQFIYVCTTASTPGTGSWTGKV